jgi:AraC-like DNA-binding protein
MVEIFQNIRKIYAFNKPCEELIEQVEFFAESSLEKTRQHFVNERFTVKMFPSWTPTFYINLGEPYHITVGNKQYLIKANDDILILRNSIVERHNLPADNIFTVKFNPGGLEAILGINQVKCIDQVIDLSAILPASLLKKIKQPICFEERIELMQQYLLSCYKKTPGTDYYRRMVHDAIGEYTAASLQLNTSAVAEKVFITSKTINRYFNRVVGISPKNYFAILRTRLALTSFIKDKELFVPGDYGYYDRSHFYKDVVKFTGQKVTRNGL